MKYSKARELISEAIEQLDELSDAKMRGYLMKSAYNAAVDAPTHGVKKRLKGIGTALKSMAGYRSPKTLGEESEKQMSTRNIKDYQGHIDRLTATIKYHKSRKPGWSDLHGNQTQSNIDAKVNDLTRIHKELTKRHKKALANHEAGNYGANKDHYLLNTDWN